MKTEFGQNSKKIYLSFAMSLFIFLSAWLWKNGAHFIRATVRMPFVKAFSLLKKSQLSALIRVTLTQILTNIGSFCKHSMAYGAALSIGTTILMPSSYPLVWLLLWRTHAFIQVSLSPILILLAHNQILLFLLVSMSTALLIFPKIRQSRLSSVGFLLNAAR